MNMCHARIILLRRNPDSLTPEEIAMLKATFPGRELSFFRTDPQDYKEHLLNCEAIQPEVVILPLERPIPSLAMEQGYAHVVITPNGLSELLPLQPQFKPFALKLES